MMTFTEVRRIAEANIHQQTFISDDALIIIDAQIIETPYAWIFPYTSQKYWETKDIQHALGGNGPVFISKLDGKVSTYRTGLSIEGMIDEHEEEYNIWILRLTCKEVDTAMLLMLKQVLRRTQPQLVDLKNSGDKVLDRGAKKRLLQLEDTLCNHHVETSLTLHAAPDNG